MISKVIFLLVLVSYAFSDSCVRYTFEENYNEWIDNKFKGMCASMASWSVDKYSNLHLSSPNGLSTAFIKPRSELSCVSSFDFPMSPGGMLEVNVYMEATDVMDQIIVLAHHSDPAGDMVIGQTLKIAMDPNFVNGWSTLTMTLTGSRITEGYISILGMAFTGSIVLVDSFRYIPPGMDESECRLYEDQPTAKHPRFKLSRA